VLLLKKLGRHLLLREDIDKQVQAYLMKLCEIGGVVNGVIARASARGIIILNCCQVMVAMLYLQRNGANIILLARIGFVKRKANSKARANVNNFVEVIFS